MASIVQILTRGERCYLVHGKYITEYCPSSGEFALRYTAAGEALLTRAAAVAFDGAHLAVCDDHKTLHLLDTASWSVKAAGTLEKAAMSVAWTTDGESVLVGDKFGDIIRFRLPPSTTEVWRGEVVAGCVSMVTDLTTNDEFIVMADRDEKIRVLREQEPFVIERFLLEHSEYVAALGWLSKRDGDVASIADTSRALFVSIGGDRRLIVWNVNEDEPVQTVTVPGDDDSRPFDPLGLTVTAHDSIIFALHNEPIIFVVPVEEERLCIDSLQRISLPHGYKPVATAALDDAVLVGGLNDDAQPFLITIKETAAQVVEEFGRYVATLEPTKSLPWLQLVRSHLRKRRLLAPRKKGRVTKAAAENDDDEEAHDEAESEAYDESDGEDDQHPYDAQDPAW